MWIFIFVFIINLYSKGPSELGFVLNNTGPKFLYRYINEYNFIGFQTAYDLTLYHHYNSRSEIQNITVKWN